MARGVNKVILIGNLGNDPETRFTPNGNAVTNLSLATDESYKDRQSGQLVPKTEWHRIVMFGKIAEIAGQYLRKGSKVYIEGKLQTRKWQGQDGQDRYTTEVVVDINGQMQMLDSRPQGGDAHSHQGQGSQYQSPGRPQSVPPAQQQQPAAPVPGPSQASGSNGYGAPDSGSQGGGGGYDSFDDDIPFHQAHWLYP